MPIRNDFKMPPFHFEQDKCTIKTYYEVADKNLYSNHFNCFLALMGQLIAIMKPAISIPKNNYLDF